MSERVKVIKGLEEALDVLEAHVPERYWGYSAEALRDAVAMLKIQEPIEPIKRENHNGFTYYHCAKCDAVLMAFRPKYCHVCGRAVKWE